MVCKKTIEAICETFVFNFQAQTVSRDAKKFVFMQIGQMPVLFRFAFSLILLAFFLEVLFCYGKTFDNLSLTKRNQIINDWKTSKIGLCRDFVRFFETFVLFESVSVYKGTE